MRTDTAMEIWRMSPWVVFEDDTFGDEEVVKRHWFAVHEQTGERRHFPLSPYVQPNRDTFECLISLGFPGRDRHPKHVPMNFDPYDVELLFLREEVKRLRETEDAA